MLSAMSGALSGMLRNANGDFVRCEAMRARRAVGESSGSDGGSKAAERASAGLFWEDMSSEVVYQGTAHV